MNYLAHIFLSCGDEELLIGNFITDFISAKQVRTIDGIYRQGVRLHRKIDTYTDSHPKFRSGTKRLSVHHHKYSPVVLDILYDHLLAQNWGMYNGQALQTFADETYGTLEKHMSVFKEYDIDYIPKMIKHNFLAAYEDKDRVVKVLERMDKRTKFPSDFKSAMDHLESDYATYDDEFNCFLPDMIRVVREVDEF